MTKEITQEERLDLTDIKDETEAYHRKFLDYCEVFELDPEKVMQEYFHDIAINSDEYKKIEAENERIQAQLDREIKINRKMKSALEKYVVDKYLEFSRAGDDMGDDNYFINFAWNDDYKDISDVLEMLAELDNKKIRIDRY